MKRTPPFLVTFGSSASGVPHAEGRRLESRRVRRILWGVCAGAGLKPHAMTINSHTDESVIGKRDLFTWQINSTARGT
ncbi:MAG: hypothetical protein K0S14_2727, partial [Thermomicrobiales bacterium]|nr:hypothetical protein [Thermomicrobiales bacterium]